MGRRKGRKGGEGEKYYTQKEYRERGVGRGEGRQAGEQEDRGESETEG